MVRAKLQIRPVSDTRAKIQGTGPSVNRPYGVSVVVKVPEDFGHWLGKVMAKLRAEPHEDYPLLKSLAGSGEVYIPAEAELTPPDGLYLVVRGPYPLNRKYGAALQVYCDDLQKFVAAVLGKEDTV
jgi:hypothetical protein